MTAGRAGPRAHDHGRGAGARGVAAGTADGAVDRRVAPRFDPARYPGDPPAGPVVVHADGVDPVRVDGTAERPLVAPHPLTDLPVLDPAAIRWSLAFGANASPERLLDKGLGRRGAVLVPAVVMGWRRVWERRRAITGAVPLTLAPAPGTRLDAWLLGIHHRDVAVVDHSEGRGERYVVGMVGPAAVADRFLLPRVPAYGPGPATTLVAGRDGPLGHPGADQAAAAAALGDDRPGLPVPPLPHPVTDGWPTSTFADLPLFTAGTLQPGQRRWSSIADLVDVVGAASTVGTAVATRHGWPAATVAVDGAAGRGEVVEGTLLAPRSPDAARRLYREADRIEGAPGRLRRVTVPVRRSGHPGTTWAAAYGVEAEQARGLSRPDGDRAGAPRRPPPTPSAG